MAVEDDIRGTGVLTNKAPELPTSEPAFDDGSLACLGINTDTRRKMFTCPAKSQTELVGKTFWVLDYFANIEGKDGQEKYIFLGYVFYHDHILIRKRIKKNIIKKLLTCKRKGMEGKELHDAMGTYQGWMNYGNTKNLKYKLNNIGNGKVFK